MGGVPALTCCGSTTQIWVQLRSFPNHKPNPLSPHHFLSSMWSFIPKGDEHAVVLLSVLPQTPLPPTFISQTNCLFPSGFCRMKDAILFCQFLWTLPFSPGTASKTVISRTLRKRTGGLLKTVNYNFVSMTKGQTRYTAQTLMPPEQETLESQYLPSHVHSQYRLQKISGCE